MVEGARLEIAYSGNRVVGSNPTRSASLFLSAMTSSLTPSQAEIAQRDQVREKLITDIKTGTTIKLPDFDSTLGLAAARFALQNVGAEPNPYGGTVGEFRYQFEGEEDLLHMFVTRIDERELSVDEARKVVVFVLPELPPAMIWLKPGTFSQHFYFGHDHWLESL